MEDLVHQTLEFITGLGYWGILLGLMLEVIPSEIVLAYAGFLVERGEINFIEAVIFGLIGCILQQWVIYWIGRYGGRPFLKKYGKYLLIKEKHIDAADRWFTKYGAGVVFTARFVPVLRQAISIPAGIAKMPLWRFTFYTALASVVWAVLFIYLGQRLSRLGQNWDQIGAYAAPYTRPIIIAAVGLTALYFIFALLKKRKRQA